MAEAAVLRGLNLDLSVLGRALVVWLEGDEGELDEVIEAGESWVPWAEVEDASSE